MDYKVVPWAIFTTPEIASVGLTEEEAKDQGIDVITGEFPFIANGKALSMNSPDGSVKLVARRDTNEVIGGQIVGPDASVMIAEIALAIQNRLTVKDIGDTIHTHPTLSEAVDGSSKGLNRRSSAYSNKKVILYEIKLRGQSECSSFLFFHKNYLR